MKQKKKLSQYANEIHKFEFNLKSPSFFLLSLYSIIITYLVDDASSLPVGIFKNSKLTKLVETSGLLDETKKKTLETHKHMMKVLVHCNNVPI